MAENKHTMSDLYQMQSLPLSAKIRMTEYRIQQWIDEFGRDGVYISFSGGKDSTVLLDIVRNRMNYPDIPSVFVDVPTQFPELKEFALSWDNVEVVRPQISFIEVCEKYGFPLISKEVSEKAMYSRKYLKKFFENKDSLMDRQIPYAFAIADFLGIERRNKNNQEILSKIKFGNIPNELLDEIFKSDGNAPTNAKCLFGQVPHKEKGVLTGELSKLYNYSRYKFLIRAPFDVSNECCKVMKKDPIKCYAKKTGRKPITAQMASESRLRTQKWIQNGCNAFHLKSPISNPMSFWTEQDILLYIKENNLPICSVYGDVVPDWDKTDDVEGQLTISDIEGFSNMELFDAERPPLKTTGCKRTGCMLCGFGCHLNNDDRFLQLKETHQKMYALLDVIKNNGITMREAIEWINEHGNLDIRL